jgi:hypothetical protein
VTPGLDFDLPVCKMLTQAEHGSRFGRAAGSCCGDSRCVTSNFMRLLNTRQLKTDRMSSSVTSTPSRGQLYPLRSTSSRRPSGFSPIRPAAARSGNQLLYIIAVKTACCPLSTRIVL